MSGVGSIHFNGEGSKGSSKCLILGGEPEVRSQPYQLAIATNDHSLVGIAKPGGGLHELIEHRLQVKSRLAYELQYVAGRRLVFQRLLQITRAGLQRTMRVCASDRDDCLLGEGLHQCDLTVRKAAGLLTTKRDGTDRVPVPHQWDR